MTHHNGSVPAPKSDWRARAACSEDQTELFFSATSAAESIAKSICRGCDVRMECREWALNNREAYGTWGAMTERERRKLLRIRVADGDIEPRKGGRPRAECGTPSAYDRHVKLGEPIDDACRAAHTRASAEKRAKQAPKKREPARCGTRGGYLRHRKNGETACAACRQANTDADNRLRRTGTTKQLAA